MSLALAKKSLSLLEGTGTNNKNSKVKTDLVKRKRCGKIKKISTSVCSNEEKINLLFMLSNSSMKEEIGERVRFINMR